MTTEWFEPSELGADVYLDLISIDFRSHYAFHDLTKIIEVHTDFADLEKRKLLALLISVARRDEDADVSLEAIYDSYCRGYYFLHKIARGPGLLLRADAVESIDGFYPEVAKDARQVISWLELGIVAPTGETDDGIQYRYIDSRPEEDREHWPDEPEDGSRSFWDRVMQMFR